MKQGGSLAALAALLGAFADARKRVQHVAATEE